MNSLGGKHMGSTADYYRYLRLKSQGIYGVDSHGRMNIERIMEHAVNRFGTNGDGSLSYAGRINMMNMFGLSTKQADLLAQMFQEGDFRKGNAKANVANLRKQMERAYGKSEDTIGGKGREVNAGVQDLQLRISNDLLPAILKFKDGLLRAEGELEQGHIVDAIRKGLQDNPLGQLAVTAGAVYLGGKLINRGGDSGGGIPGWSHRRGGRQESGQGCSGGRCGSRRGRRRGAY